MDRFILPSCQIFCQSPTPRPHGGQDGLHVQDPHRLLRNPRQKCCLGRAIVEGPSPLVILSDLLKRKSINKSISIRFDLFLSFASCLALEVQLLEDHGEQGGQAGLHVQDPHILHEEPQTRALLGQSNCTRTPLMDGSRASSDGVGRLVYPSCQIP